MAQEVLSKIMSSIIRVRQDEDGTFIPVFPINTTNEVYADIDNKIKLSTFLNGMFKYRTVNNISSMYALTSSEVNLYDLIVTSEENKYFFVIDLNNLNSELGYLEILTADNIRGPNGLAQLDDSGKLALDDVEPMIEFITYSHSSTP